MDILPFIALAPFPVLMVVGGLHDLTTMRIPNWISLALLAAFLPAALLLGLAPLDMAAHLGVGVAALLAGMALFALNWVGGGDAKLLAAACLWMGPAGSLPFLLSSAIVGGLFCLALITARRTIPAFPGLPAWAARLLEPKGDVPYGVALAGGALLAFPASPLVAAFVGG
ncbi:MAG: pilus assembly protein CpaA [Brevundimonas sp.]|jgi:prepilin peptidase CpaA|uniref:Prepilin peptidase n=2 Tax=Brevundimonas TaxID=41275 RepID=A0ABY4SKH9_9CAUL|nr:MULTISPECIES: prepilin peptidase [Brevundimonas]MCV0414217.1 prepilin peptidase [Brevundimonas sp.]PZU55498.1 MAG: pilus assembly protein CpaA [Brevundimonas sp.]UQV17371.1 prepilin peptidase [Brevundimonas albigilva]URI14774.1 prepilin peptidase [Brevundimonas albigilva]